MINDMKDSFVLGTVIKLTGGFYYVDIDGEVLECKARGVFRNLPLSVTR